MQPRSAVVSLKICIGLTLALAGWTVIASLVFLLGTGLFGSFERPFYQWWPYFFYGRDNPVVVQWLKIGAGVASAFLVVFLVALIFRRGKIGPSLRPSIFSKKQGVVRGVTDNHGHAEWLAMKDALRMFPGPNAPWGGIVIGEAYRVDQDRVAKTQIDPANPKTWGQGGKAPLLIDPCSRGSTHSILFSGPGGFKSSRAVSTLLTWTGSVVVLDPSVELGPMLKPAREVMGHRVYTLGLRDDVGFNVLDWIDIQSPEAITNIQDVVSWVCGVSALKQDKTNEFFESTGRQLVTCLLCHLLWDDQVPAEEKNLMTLRAGLSIPQDDMRVVLDGIYRTSRSPLARDYAGTLKGLVDETFSGVYGHATDTTSWLGNPAFAKLVSGNDFKTAELATGKASVFVQLPLRALENTPAIGRVIIGALLNAAYEADGNVNGRILYLLDEVARLGYMRIIEIARDAGRKYGITLQLFYQSVGQLEDQWGRTGKKKWYDGVSYRIYNGVTDLDTAKELEETFGNYGVMATSVGDNSGTSGKSFGESNRSKGQNTNYHEISRPLLRREEIMQDCREDEQFVVARNARPLRCGMAIYFRRADMKAAVAANRFSKPARS